MAETTNSKSGYDKIVDRYFSHIEPIRRGYPPQYSESIIDKVINTGAAKNNYDTPRNRDNPDYFRIGDCVLQIPPDKINVLRQSESDEYVGLRQKDSHKAKSGYHLKEVTINITFNGEEQINGREISGLDGPYYVDGLRPLIAQLKRTPFLPVENDLLNNIHNIYGLVILGVNISTQEGFPKTISGQLVGYEFNAQPYITLPSSAITDVMDWDVFRWYYQKAMDQTTDGLFLGKVNKTITDHFNFYLVDEDELSGHKANSTTLKAELYRELNMTKYEMPDDIYMTNIQIGVGNIIKNIQLSAQASPVTQYFGCTSSMISCTFETTNPDAVTLFNFMNDTCERYARQYRNRTVQGYIKFENELVQLFGVTYVLIDSVKIETVENYPGLYIINVLMSSFDKTQAKANRPQSISELGSRKGNIKDLLAKDDDTSHMRSVYYDKVVEDQLNLVELYPDLELPTYEEYVDALNKINKKRVEFDLSELPASIYYTNNKSDEADLVQWVDKSTEEEAITDKFPDVKSNHFAYKHILAMVNKNIFTGYPDGSFKPDDSITRAQSCTILYYLMRINDPPYTTVSYKDMNKEAWYVQYIEGLKERGVISGYPDGTFRPDNTISRQDFIVLLCKARMVTIKDLTIENTITASDKDDIAPYAKLYVAYAIKQGWVKGYPDGTIRPLANITRAQACVLSALVFKITVDLPNSIVSGKFILSNKDYKNVFVDPDFYFSYPSLDQAGISSLVDGITSVNDIKQRVSQDINDMEKPWQLRTTASNIDKDTKDALSNGSTSSSSTTKTYNYGTYNNTTEESTQNIKVYSNDKNITAEKITEHFNATVTDAWINSESILKKLEGGIGKHVMKVAEATGLNPAFVYGVSMHESGWGKSQIAYDKWNFYGMGAFNDSPGESAHNYRADGKTFALNNSCYVAGGIDISKRVIIPNFDESKRKELTVIGLGDSEKYAVSDAKHPNSGHNWGVTVATIMYRLFVYCGTSNIQAADNTEFGSPLEGISIQNILDSYNEIKIKGSSTLIRNEVSLFGYKRTEGRLGKHDHNGIDLFTKGNILAAADGEVVQMDLYDGENAEGNWIVIDHKNGKQTYYMHMSSFNSNIKMNARVKKGDILGVTGNSGTDDGDKKNNEGIHLHFTIVNNGTKEDPISYFMNNTTSTTTDGRATSAASPISTTARGGSLATGASVEMPPIDWTKLGRPIRARIGDPDAFSNKKDELIERIAIDMIQNNRRGTMCRAFPAYLMLFVDEGSWLGGRKLWSNYYVYHSLIDITVEKDRRKPADTAVVRLINIYNSLGIETKTYYNEKHTWSESFYSLLGMYSDSSIKSIIDLKNETLTAFNIKPGARIHLRMGYGSDVRRMPVVFNGTIAEVNTQDIVTIVAQGDGEELTRGIIGQEEEDATNTMWGLGNEPQNIISNILLKRESNFLSMISSGAFQSSSAYGIEHFGTVYMKGTDDPLYKGLAAIKAVQGALTLPTLVPAGMAITAGVLDSKAVERLGLFASSTFDKILTVLMPNDLANELRFENYDICKNIYLANVEAAKTDINKEADIWKETWMFFNFGDGEKNIRLFLYNRSPWDIFQTLAAATPEFICYPHDHQFRSTLFFGMPHWNVKYKYEYVSETEVYEYAKPYSQCHVLTSLYDIVDNKISVVGPVITNCIGTFIDTSGGRIPAPTVYADRSIRSDLWKTSIVDSTVQWGIGSALTDNILGQALFKWIFNINPGKDHSRRIAIATVQQAFKDMYDGSLVILGDGSIKPYDTIYMDDTYTGMCGTVEVGRVVIHMGIDTGFITDIKPDLCVSQADVDATKIRILRSLTILASAIVIYAKSASMATSIIDKYRKLAEGMVWVKNIATYIKRAKNLSTVWQGINALQEVRATAGLVTTISKIGSSIKAGITAAGFVGAPETLGASLVVAGISLVLFNMLDRMFTTVIDYIENFNVIKIYPLWYKNKPYVSGINGHKNIIPGWKDEDFYINQESDTSRFILNRAITTISKNNPDEGDNLKEDSEEMTKALTPEVLKEERKEANKSALTQGMYDYGYVDRMKKVERGIPLLGYDKETGLPNGIKPIDAIKDPENSSWPFENTKRIGDKITYRPIKAEARSSMTADMIKKNQLSDAENDKVVKDLKAAREAREAQGNVLDPDWQGGGDSPIKIATNESAFIRPKRSSYIVEFTQLCFKGILTPLPVFAFYDGDIVGGAEYVPMDSGANFFDVILNSLEIKYKGFKDYMRAVYEMNKYTSYLIIDHKKIGLTSIYYNITAFDPDMSIGKTVEAGDLLGQIRIKEGWAMYQREDDPLKINRPTKWIQGQENRLVKMGDKLLFCLYRTSDMSEVDPLTSTDPNTNIGYIDIDATFTIEDYKRTGIQGEDTIVTLGPNFPDDNADFRSYLQKYMHMKGTNDRWFAIDKYVRPEASGIYESLKTADLSQPNYFKWDKP